MAKPADMRLRPAVLFVVAVLSAAVVPAHAAPVKAVSVFAAVDVAHPDTSVVAPDGTVLVSTNRGARGSTGPSVVYRFSPAGTLLRRYVITGQASGDHGAMGMAFDSRGRLYVADYAPARVLRIDLASGRQTTYATVPDLPVCPTASGPGCDNGIPGGPRQDAQPWPDGLAFLPDGTLLVTDLAQGTVFSVANGGGAARTWLQGPELHSTFGPNQVQLDRHGNLLLDVTASTVPAVAGRGVLYRLPVVGGRPGPLTQVYATRPGEGPDGFALAASGSVYLCTLVTDTVITIAPDGTEAGRLVRTPADAVPFDSPSSATFLGTDLLITNLTYFTDRTQDDLVLRLTTADRGVPAYRPVVHR